MDEFVRIRRVSEVIAFILGLMGGETRSKTKLVKLIYLLDVVQARKGNSHEFSGVRFKRYYYGPYSDDIDDALELLQKNNCISMKSVLGYEHQYFHIKLIYPPPYVELSESDRQQIHNSLGQLVDLNLRTVLDVAYATDEFKSAEFGEPITL